MALNVGALVASLQLNSAQFTQGLNNAQSSLMSFGQMASGIGATLTATLTVPIVAFGKQSAKTFMSFDDGMRKVSAVSGATGIELENLTDIASEMGRTTRYTARDSADALLYMGQAGWEASEMMAGLEPILNLATAGGTDLGTTSDIVTDALTAFGLSAEDTAIFTDQLAQVSRKTNTDVNKLGLSYKMCASLAGTLGYSTADTNVALGLMANAGIKGSTAGSSLRSVLTNLAKPTDELRVLMDALGIAIADEHGNIKPLNQLMLEMRGIFSQLNKEQQASIAASIAGKEGMSGLLAIMNASDESFNQLTEDMANADGTAKEMAEQMEAGLGGAIRSLLSALEGLAITIGEKLAPYIQMFAEKIIDLTAWFQALGEEEQNQKMKLLGLAAAIGPILLAISGLGAALVASVGAFITFGAGLFSFGAGLISAIATPIGALIALALSLGAVVGSVFGYMGIRMGNLYEESEEFRGKIEKISISLQEIYLTLVEKFDNAITSLEPIFAVWDGFWVDIETTIDDTIGNIVEALEGVCVILEGIVKGDFKLAMLGMKKVVLETAQACVEYMVGMTTGMVDAINGLLDVINEKTGLNLQINSIESTGTDYISKWLDEVNKEILTARIEGGSAILNGASGDIKDSILGIKSFTSWKPLGDMTTRIAENLNKGPGDTISETINAIKEMTSNSINPIDVPTIDLSLVEQLLNGIKDNTKKTNDLIIDTKYKKHMMYGSIGDSIVRLLGVEGYIPN